MNESSKVPPNQLRWSTPWRGTGIRCKGCSYLAPAGKDLWQCTAAHDFAGVVSDAEGALCLRRPTNFGASLLASGDTTSDTIDDVESEDPKSCFDDHLCPRCRAPTETTKNGCFICPNCGFRDCEW